MKYKNRYRVKSARLCTWNYGWAGAYFITICTKHRYHYFGKIRSGEIRLSEIGGIARNELLLTPKIRTDMNLTLGEFVIMPNHIHVILNIDRNEYNSKEGMHGHVVRCRTAMLRGLTSNNQFGPQSKNLASVIRGYKSAVTKQARIIDSDFAWQARYYDHIIRNAKSHNNISKYIINNPLNWKEDMFFEK